MRRRPVGGGGGGFFGYVVARARGGYRLGAWVGAGWGRGDVGWDPAAGKIRSWLFDADGGFAEGYWTVLEDGVVIKSASVNPDSSTASATMTIVPDGKDRFTITGTDRIVGDGREDDFEINVVRRPPGVPTRNRLGIKSVKE